jgi:hypothetical protein
MARDQWKAGALLKEEDALLTEISTKLVQEIPFQALHSLGLP